MRARRKDENHNSVASHLESIGWSLHDTASYGRGMGDALVSRLGHTAILEIKSGKGELNELQRKFRDKWQGAYFVVRSPDDAERQLTLWLLTQVRFRGV